MAIRLPAGLVQALDLKEGAEGDLHLAGAKAFEADNNGTNELLARLLQCRGRLRADFHTDRLQANEQDNTS